MEDWEERLSGFLKLWDREILQDAGKVTAELANAHAESEFEKYRIVQDRLFESDFDKVIKQIEVRSKPSSRENAVVPHCPNALRNLAGTLIRGIQ